MRIEHWETPYVGPKKGEKKRPESSSQGSKKKVRRNVSVTEEACEDSMPRGESVAAYSRTEE